MTAIPSYTVAVVLDCCFGPRLLDLASRAEAVWVSDTSDNRVFVEECRSQARTHRPGITTFKVAADETPEDAFVRILPTVDTHHNELAADGTYTALEVYGAEATAGVRTALGEFELKVVQEGRDYFRAEGPAANA